MTQDFTSEATRTAAIADKMQGPSEKRIMRMISDSYMELARNDAIRIPQYERP